jgi:hypothetical protein
MFFKIRCIGFTSWRSKFLGFTRSTLASHICSTDSIPWVHHSREEGYLGYDGRHVRLQVYLKFNMIIHRQQWLGATLAADVFCTTLDAVVDTCIRTTMCQDLVDPRVRIWLVHVSWSYWATCQDPIGPCVMILLGHESGSDWSTCRDLIWPRVCIWLVHVSESY